VVVMGGGFLALEAILEGLRVLTEDIMIPSFTILTDAFLFSIENQVYDNDSSY